MTGLILKSLPWHGDSRYWLERIACLPGAACLDSGLTRRNEARYDIFTALPTTQLKLTRCPTDGLQQLWQRPFNQTAWQLQPQGQDLFSTARQLLAARQPAADISADLRHLPFSGGLVGSLAYPFGQDKRSGYRSDHKLAQAALLHAQPEASVGLYEWAVIVDHQRQHTQLFILPGCPQAIRTQVLVALDNEAATTPETDITSISAAFSATAVRAGLSTDSGSCDFSLTAAFQPLSQKTDYQAAFERLKEWIYAGDCYQANLAIAFHGQYQGNPLTAYLRLRQASRSPFSAYLATDNGAILSLSPERFLSVRDRNVLTQPIKGTRRRSSDPDEDREIVAELTASAKDRAENLMIVDLLRNDLGRVCMTGSVQTPALFSLHSFSHVHHLISTVTGRLPADVSPLRLLQQAFPGGSITGAPKIRAMQIISVLEPVPRSIYCGSIFYHDFNGQLDSNICIRTLLCADGQIFCWGGGGVVADSDCEREYVECHDKVTALMQTLS